MFPVKSDHIYYIDFFPIFLLLFFIKGKTLIRLETRTKLTTKCDKSYFDFDDEENANKNRDRNVYVCGEKKIFLKNIHNYYINSIID